MITPGEIKLISGGVGALVIGGALYYQSLQIHHFHQLYDGANTTIALRDQQIKDMTTAQNNQKTQSEANVIKVVQGPKEVQSIIREIHSAPSSGACKPPSYSEVVTNAF